MANESRRRTGLETTSKAPQVDTQTIASLYKSLAVGSTSIRLLKVKKPISFEEPIDCEIFTAAFKDLPTFVALSYKWGTDEPKQRILLNGVATEVGQNLSEALQYLQRHDSGEEPYWVDALCINQQDIAERNQQVGIMRHIYQRASTVLIWLGKKYERYDAILPKLGEIADTVAGPGENPEVISQASIHGKDLQPRATEDKLNSRTLAKELHKDEYWSRVWIIQEIGLAAQLKVCLGNCSTSWTHLINFMTFHDLGNEGPLELNQQRQTERDGGCELLQLIDHFKHAKCKDQRDKIYGLVGLAMDARLFPIDYNKSLFDIWRDVMEFAKLRHMLKDQDIISIARLVKFTLMGNGGQPLEQLLRPYSPVEEATTIIDKPECEKVFRIPGRIIGCVQHVGPRIDDIVENPKHQEEWEYHVHTNYRHDASRAYREGNGFIRGIIGHDRPHLYRACFSYTSVVQWTTSTSSYHDPNIDSDVIRMVRYFQSQDHTRKKISEVVTTPETQSTNTRLYQLDGFNGDNDWRFGIASDQVRLGDLICWVESTSRALVIRLVKNDPLTFQAVGTAVVADDIKGSSVEKHANRFRGFRSLSMPTFIDSTLIFILLGCGSADKIY